MTKVWNWLKRAGVWIAGGLLLLLGVGWLWRTQSAKLGQLRDRATVEKALSETYKLRAQRTAVAERVGEKDDAIEEIDRRLDENKRRIIEAHEHGEGMTDDEVDDAFDRLGY